MPNHFLWNIMIGVGADPRVCPEKEKIYPPAAGLRFYVGAGSPCPHLDGTTQKGAVTAPLRRSLGQAVAYFKYQLTKSINQIFGTVGSRLWQRNYFEHIIRNEDELNGIREYIENNPMQWAFDNENPEREDVPATAGLRSYVGATLRGRPDELCNCATPRRGQPRGVAPTKGMVIQQSFILNRGVEDEKDFLFYRNVDGCNGWSCLCRHR